MKALRLIRQFWIHAILLAGCVVFAFPFLWLVSTSAKRNEELAVFPPRWIPQIPWYCLRSPFIDGDAFGEMKAPEQIPGVSWQRLRPAVEDVLWRRIEQALGPDRLKMIAAAADHDRFRPQAVAGLWLQVMEVVPDRVWQQSREADRTGPAPAEKAPLLVFVGNATTAEMVNRVAQAVVRRLAVGEVMVRSINNDLVPPDWASGWKGEGCVAIGPDEIDGERCLGLAYDFRRGDAFSIVQTLRLPVPLERTAAATDPQGRGGRQRLLNLQTLNLPIHCDGSWHRATLTVETAGRVYRAERPLWMDIRTWQEAEFAFREPPYRGSRAIVMRPDERAVSDVADPNTFRLTLTLDKSGRLRAAFDKYVDSYRWALRYIPFDAQLRNTVILVVLNVLGQLFACSLVAYGFARLNFYGRNVLFGLLLATMMLPGQVTMIPQFMLWKTLGWYNTLRPLWVPAWFGGAFFVFLLRQFFMTIPKELEDAAKIDGCGFFGIYWRIMLPLAGPAMATVAIFSFMGAWHEFVGPLVYLSDERLFPLSLGLNQFRQEQSAEWAMLMAASTLMMLPVVAVFFFCQRYFIQGVTLTGLKG
jgi:ABC-type glycerol-3-phosphate transport system permease component